MDRRGRPKMQSGTCNLCSAPCSSCMHRNAGFTDSKYDELSDENSHGVVASECSYNGDDIARSSGLNAIGGSHKTSSVLLNKADESNISAMSESESADSEMMEVDVKVCDTCGDAGREDLLAFCSKCSDGAEHIYCMQVRLEKVPKGDWLCEDCKFADEAEKQMLETKGKRESTRIMNSQSSRKRRIDKFEAALDSKRLAVEAPTGSPKRSVLPRLSTLSRETSFKGLEKPTRKLAHHSSFNCNSSDDGESIRCTDLQPAKGSLFKSNSFNSSISRPKVRPVDDAMLSQQKTRKQNSSLDLKEGFYRNVGKSMSSRCTDGGSSSYNDAKVDGSKQLKDPSAEANPPTSTIDKKLFSRGNSSISLHNGKQGGLTKQARHLTRNRLEDIVASVGDSSTNEKCSSSEPISCEAKCKNEPASVDGLPQSAKIREAGEKSKEAVGNQQSRNIREDINKGNRLRAAVDAALRKKPSFGKNRGLEQSDLPTVSNVDSGVRSLPSNVSVVREWPVGFKGLPGGHPNLRPEKQSIAVNTDFTLAGTNATAASQYVGPEVHGPSLKPAMRDLPAAAPAVSSTTSAIPEHEYIWQGDLEVQKSRNLSLMHSGIQAYLSTLASPKVVEVVKQFPVKVALNEVPRISTWPAQLQEGAKEHHVALFFFAKDIESYEKNYKPLVDNMIQKDLALKGNLEGVELLIFASNQLPQDFQRWNMLFFLWGVFRGKKKNCCNPLKNTPIPTSCLLPNMGKAFSTRETFHHENASNRECLTDRTLSQMQSCMKENAKEGKACAATEKEKALSVSYGDSGADEEAEEGEIGLSPNLKDEKASGPSTVNSSDLDDPNKERFCKRVVFPLDLNDGKENDDDEMFPNLELALGEEKTTPSMTGTTSIDEHRSGTSHKPQDKIVNQKDNAASLSL